MSGIIGTGGHIDHGKTALVAALTGEDTDRLPEEKRRGISIDLGFSHLELEGVRHGIVDVPGHEDFIRNMLAGATGMDVLLLVVAADEGVMPQTREHVAIAGLLEVPRAVVALTKTDLVEDEWLALVRDDVSTFLAGTPFAGAPLVPVSSRSGTGIGALREELARALDAPRRTRDDLFRLPIDRAFTVRGTGTVVTGTVWSGSLHRAGTVRVEPGGITARIRGLQVHGRDAEAIGAGERAAVALTGVDRDAVPRGATLVLGDWAPASILTVRLSVLAGSEWSIEQRQRVRVHLGTAEVMARVRLLDRERLQPGEAGWGQLRLESPLLARARDRCVLRSYSPVTTIGGAVVAEPAAPKRRRLDPAAVARLLARTEGPPEAAVAAVLDETGARGIAPEDLPVQAGVTPAEAARALAAADAVSASGLVYPAAAAESASAALLEVVDSHHHAWPLRPGIEQEELRRSAPGSAGLVQAALDALVAEGTLERRAGRIGRSGYRPPDDPQRDRRADAVAAALEAAGASPPDEAALAAAAGEGKDPLDELLAYMEAEGRIVRLHPGVYLHQRVLDALVAELRHRLGGRSGLGPADFRAVVDVSRKHLIPLLEYLDVAGVTVRQGEGRAVPVAAAGA